MYGQDYDHDSHVFLVSAQGYAGDHLFSWFSKSLNAHPDIFCYLANEGSRPKYFKERSRSERPDLFTYVKFISDVGRTYSAVGDCYSYRAYQLSALRDCYGDSVRFVNLIRHPFIWSYYYVSWRCSNMRMPSSAPNPIEHEWSRVDHSKFKGLKSYTKTDVEIWAFYRAMEFMDNHFQRDLSVDCRHIPIESVVNDRDLYISIVSYLTHDRLNCSADYLNIVWNWLDKPFRGELPFTLSPSDVWALWADWQKEAFYCLVKPSSLESFAKSGGYVFDF